MPHNQQRVESPFPNIFRMSTPFVIGFGYDADGGEEFVVFRDSDKTFSKPLLKAYSKLEAIRFSNAISAIESVINPSDDPKQISDSMKVILDSTVSEALKKLEKKKGS